MRDIDSMWFFDWWLDLVWSGFVIVCSSVGDWRLKWKMCMCSMEIYKTMYYVGYSPEWKVDLEGTFLGKCLADLTAGVILMRFTKL